MDKLYYVLTSYGAPLVFLWLLWRRARGKEDAKRFRERFGITSKLRPKGTLLWLHAASVGEANSVLLFLEKIRARFPELSILLTTGTVTSAMLMQQRLPKDIIHQYVPVDTPQACERFMHSWKPDIALWVESEFWPNLIFTARRHECFMGVINARMSRRSYLGWRRFPDLIHKILASFDVFYAQSEEDRLRLELLGARRVINAGNLKFDATLLPCDEAELVALKNTLAGRPVWLAASTHPGEEDLIAKAHALIAATRPQLLTVIVPRHPERGKSIADAMKARAALRSRKDKITAETAFYIADTLGELGLFYRLCEIVFMGGSLVKHGGQNPLEAARLSCAIVYGPHVHNFNDIYQEMQKAGACLQVKNLQDLAAAISRLFSNASQATAMQTKARQWVESKGGAAQQLLEMISPIFVTPRAKSR